jgi:hypothetical protein
MLNPCKLILTVCIQLLHYGLEGLATGLKVMVPCSGLLIRQFNVFVLSRSRPVLLELKGFLALFRNIMQPDPAWIHAAGAPVTFPTQRLHDSVAG